jgi:hypothetical protein
MKAWHFVRQDRRLGFGDKRLVIDGETLYYTGNKPINLCEQGLHFSVNVLDALKYAPGLVACYVEVPDTSIVCDDKGVATCRTVIKSIDTSEILVRFAITQALNVYEDPFFVKWANDWLTGSDRSYDAATRAAKAADAYAKAADAYAYAAAAKAAAAKAADAATRAAAAYADTAAAKAAAKAGVRKIQNKMLESMILEAMGLNETN